MSVSIRAMRSEAARRFLEIQRESVRGIAARDYPTAVIDAWAPLPITDAVVERFLSNRDGEMRLIRRNRWPRRRNRRTCPWELGTESLLRRARYLFRRI